MTTFQELPLIKPLQQAIAAENYETPTPIQAQTIPAALEGRDILGCAQTGTGKTAAFALPLLNALGKDKSRPVPHLPQALVLVPTRELAIQVGESFTTYGRKLRVRQALVYGGVSQFRQVRDLARGVHLLIATPGRLLDLMNQGEIELDELQYFVVDEADRMMDMGFLPDLKKIIQELPPERQSLFFSATLPPKITELAQGLLNDPHLVTIEPEVRSVEKIEQSIIYVEAKEKKALLLDLLANPEVGQTVVFTKTKFCANRLEGDLQKAGVKAIAIHGNKSQNARQKALLAFRQEKMQVLVATDVAARGIDVDGVTHVINYELPHEAENYVHRIGRTGRAGASGIAISFCSREERGELFAIERYLEHAVPVDEERSQFMPDPQERIPSGNRRGKRPFRKGGRPNRYSEKSSGPSSQKRPFPHKSKKSQKSRTGVPFSQRRSDENKGEQSSPKSGASRSRNRGHRKSQPAAAGSSQ